MWSWAEYILIWGKDILAIAGTARLGATKALDLVAERKVAAIIGGEVGLRFHLVSFVLGNRTTGRALTEMPRLTKAWPGRAKTAAIFEAMMPLQLERQLVLWLFFLLFFCFNPHALRLSSGVEEHSQ